MSSVIVADTGPLIALSLIELLPESPNLFEAMYAPPAVIHEATYDSSKPGAIGVKSALHHDWVQVPQVVEDTTSLRKFSTLLDQGEAEALTLAQQLASPVLIDERKGRRVVQAHDILVTGTLAVLIKAKKLGIVTTVKPLLENLARHGYRLSPQLVSEVLRSCGE